MKALRTAEWAARVLCLVCLCYGCLFLLGCNAERVSPIERLYKMRDAVSIPHGLYFNSEAEKWEAGFIAAETAEALYRFDGYTELHHAERYAVYLSDRFDTAYEIGIFDAPDRSAQNELIAMCLRRIDLLSRNGRDGKGVRVATVGYSVVYFFGFDEESVDRLLAAGF